MTLIAGIDWSSAAIDVAIIPADADHGDPAIPPVTLRRMAIPAPTPMGPRTGHAAHLTRQLLEPVNGHEVTWVWIEEAWGAHRNVDRVILPIYGAIEAAAWRPGWRQVQSITVSQWRAHHHLPRYGQSERKAQSVARALDLCPTLPPSISDHAAEAYLIAIAGRDIIHAGTR